MTAECKHFLALVKYRAANAKVHFPVAVLLKAPGRKLVKALFGFFSQQSGVRQAANMNAGLECLLTSH